VSTLADGLCQVAAVKKIRSDRIIFRGAIICYHSWVPFSFKFCLFLLMLRQNGVPYFLFCCISHFVRLTAQETLTQRRSVTLGI
jgi:hypothetical protein